MPGIPSKDASFVWGTPRNYALTIQFYKKREIYIYMRKWDMFKLERLSI